jgi:hypothetical protein
MMTICPKRLQVVAVSTTTNPVTQVAEVAVNKAFRKPMLSPLCTAKGSVSRRLPARIVKKKLKVISLAGLVETLLIAFDMKF